MTENQHFCRFCVFCLCVLSGNSHLLNRQLKQQQMLLFCHVILLIAINLQEQPCMDCPTTWLMGTATYHFKTVGSIFSGFSSRNKAYRLFRCETNDRVSKVSGSVVKQDESLKKRQTSLRNSKLK